MAVQKLMILGNQPNENEVRKKTTCSEKTGSMRRTYTTRDSDQGILVKVCVIRTSFSVQGLQGGNLQNRELPTMKISSDKRIKGILKQFLQFPSQMNFQIAIALAGLQKDEFDMHQFTHRNQLLVHKVHD